MYILPVGNIIAPHDLKHQQYAEDTQLYMAVRPNASLTLEADSDCIDDVPCWFLENGLLLYPSKTKAVGSALERSKKSFRWQAVPIQLGRCSHSVTSRCMVSFLM